MQQSTQMEILETILSVLRLAMTELKDAIRIAELAMSELMEGTIDDEPQPQSRPPEDTEDWPPSLGEPEDFNRSSGEHDWSPRRSY